MSTYSPANIETELLPLLQRVAGMKDVSGPLKGEHFTVEVGRDHQEELYLTVELLRDGLSKRLKFTIGKAKTCGHFWGVYGEILELLQQLFGRHGVNLSQIATWIPHLLFVADLQPGSGRVEAQDFKVWIKANKSLIARPPILVLCFEVDEQDKREVPVQDIQKFKHGFTQIVEFLRFALSVEPVREQLA